MKKYQILHIGQEVANDHIAKIKARGGKVNKSVKDGKILLEYSFPDEEIKTWIKEKSLKITDGYKNPFTGDLMDDRKYVHFKTFAVALEEANKFNSFDELLAAKIKIIIRDVVFKT